MKRPKRTGPVLTEPEAYRKHNGPAGRMINRLKELIKLHRLPRKQAALQNLLLTVIVVLIGMFGLRAYSSNYSPQAMVDQWCRENYFGKAEIHSQLVYEDGKNIEVFFSREDENGEQYSGYMELLQRSFNRWNDRRSMMWNTAPVDSAAFIILQSAPTADGRTYTFVDTGSRFYEFNSAEYLELNLAGNKEKQTAEVRVFFLEDGVQLEAEPTEAVYFKVDLFSETCLEWNCPWFAKWDWSRGRNCNVKFEFTEERMIHIAKVLAEYVKENQEEA